VVGAHHAPFRPADPWLGTCLLEGGGGSGGGGGGCRR
jgi:hypothetical protein